MVKVCSWCRRVSGIKMPFFSLDVTDGICSKCKAKVEKNYCKSKEKGL